MTTIPFKIIKDMGDKQLSISKAMVLQWLAKAGLFDEETNQKYIADYNDFLIQRKAIKEQIQLDWELINK